MWYAPVCRRWPGRHNGARVSFLFRIRSPAEQGRKDQKFAKSLFKLSK